MTLATAASHPPARKDIAPDRHFDRGAWLVLAIVAAWFLVTALVSAVALGYPSDGFTITRNSVTGTALLNNRFHALPTPLRTGDAVLAINGQPLGLNGTAPVGPATRAGDVLIYSIERAGQQLEVPVTLAAPGPSGFWPGLLLRLAEPRDFLVATLAFAVTLWAFLARPGNLGARYLLLTFSYYAAVQWFGFFTSELYTPAMPGWIILLLGLEGGGWFWFFFPSMTLVALSFPVVKWPLRRFPRLLPALLYGLPLLAGVFSLSETLAGNNSGVWGQAALPIFVGILVVTVLALAGAILHNWFTVREAITRAQLRWVTLGLTLGLLVPFAWLLLSLAVAGAFPTNDLVLWLPLFVPVTLAIAITRYRLFDIDIIIRRTLVYASLSGLLALLYFGGVVVFEALLRGVTGGSQLAIVISTLLIAALFGPLRARVQALIDRRFFRRKYDAARTLAAFSASVRDNVDLDALGDRLTTVVEETMQPASVSLWAPQRKRE